MSPITPFGSFSFCAFRFRMAKNVDRTRQSVKRAYNDEMKTLVLHQTTGQYISQSKSTGEL